MLIIYYTALSGSYSMPIWISLLSSTLADNLSNALYAEWLSSSWKRGLRYEIRCKRQSDWDSQKIEECLVFLFGPAILLLFGRIDLDDFDAPNFLHVHWLASHWAFAFLIHQSVLSFGLWVSVGSHRLGVWVWADSLALKWPFGDIGLVSADRAVYGFVLLCFSILPTVLLIRGGAGHLSTTVAA